MSVACYKFKMMMGDRLFFAAMVLIPFLITMASGYALRYEKRDIIPVAAVDEDGSSYSGLLVERVSAKEGLGLSVAGREKALDLLERGKVEQVFVIRKGFEKAVRRGESKGLIELFSAPSSYSAGFTGEIIAGEAIRMIAENLAANRVETQYGELGIRTDGSFRDGVLDYVESLWEPKPLMTIEYKELKAGLVQKPEHAVLPASSASSAGLVTAFILFYMLFGSSWLIEERTNGTIKRLGAGTGALAASFGGGVIALFLAGMLQIALFSVLQKLLFDVSLFSGPWSYAILAAYLLAVIGVSMFLSSVLKTQAQLQAGAPVLALVTGFAGGCFWNFVPMPDRLSEIALLTPQGWALQGINSLLLDPAGASAAFLPLCVLSSMALILLPASYIIINMQLRLG